MWKINLKELLKSIKLNEQTISMVLGAVVVLVIGLLIINYFRNGNRTVTLTKEQATESATESNKNLSAKEETKTTTTHTVEKGEHLWMIAETYYRSGYNWTDIAEANSLANPNKIEVGQELTIPDVPAKTATVRSTQETPSEEASVNTEPTQTELPKSPIEGESYEVQTGDYLWSIAIRAYGDGYRWVDIAKENSLANPNIIHPGNELKLPR